MSKARFVPPNSLRGRLEFPDQGVSAFADEVLRLVKAGFLRTVSVGFRPTVRPQPNELGGVDFKGQHLAEASLVNIPANLGAVIDGVREDEGVLLRKWWDAEQRGEVVLDVDMTDDDDVIGALTPDEVRAAWRAGLQKALREAVATAVRRGVRQGLAVRSSEPFADPSVPRHSTRDGLDVDADRVRVAVREAVQESVAAAFRGLRGRLD